MSVQTYKGFLNVGDWVHITDRSFRSWDAQIVEPVTSVDPETVIAFKITADAQTMRMPISSVTVELLYPNLLVEMDDIPSPVTIPSSLRRGFN